MPYYITENDIQIYLQNTQMQIRALGSGNSFNKILLPNRGYRSLRNVALGRDWEIWINLKDRVKSNVMPVLNKKKLLDGSYIIKVMIGRDFIDKLSHFEKVIPLYFINKTQELYNVDLYHTKIPKNPHYVTRTINNTKGEIFNIFTVHNKVLFTFCFSSPI